MFEVVYHYHERQEDGKYNTDVIKQMKKKIGDVENETPLDQLASTIRAQLARRKIWIVDVEIFEYSKKKVTFREADDGSIVIKNKKFSPNNTSSEILVEEDEKPQIVPQNVSIPQPISPNVNLATTNRPIATFVFDPDMDIRLQTEAKQKGYKFTMGKKYNVFAIDSPTQAQALLGATEIYHVDDDLGRRRKVAAEYFVPVLQGGLVGDNETIEGGGFSRPIQRGQPEPKLMYESNYIGQNEMPDLRSKQKMTVSNVVNENYVDYNMPDLRAKK